MYNTAASKGLVGIMLMITAVFFVNFDVVDLSALKQVDQRNRVQHAKELLGSGYSGSVVQKAEKIKDLHVSIFNNVQKNLPRKYKGQSLSLSETIIAEAQARNLDPVFVMAVIKTESSFNPTMRGSHGEIGLMQIKPDTGKWVALRKGLPWHGRSTLESPMENVRLGVAYLAMLREKADGFANTYVSAYNMGLSKVLRLYKTSRRRPQIYSLKVMKNYRDIYSHLVVLSDSEQPVEASAVDTTLADND
jgi:soluble lytic murein transglycosylase